MPLLLDARKEVPCETMYNHCDEYAGQRLVHVIPSGDVAETSVFWLNAKNVDPFQAIDSHVDDGIAR